MNDRVSTYDMAIDGGWSAATDGATYEALNPFTGTAWALAPDATKADVDRAVDAASRAIRGPVGYHDDRRR